MARPPRRSDDGGQHRRRRRRLHILTNHNGDQGMSIYKLNEDGFDSDDAYCEDSRSVSSEDSGSISSEEDSSDSGSISSEASSFTSSEDEMDSFEAQDRFDTEYDVDSKARRLRHCRLVARLGRQEGCPDFVAAGTKIVGLNSSSYHVTTINFVFDAATRMVSVTPPFRSPKKSATFWAVGGTVYALDLVADESRHAKERCLFERLGPEPRRHYGTWQWEALPPPPFNKPWTGHVTSHAVHPDGATVFLSFYKTGTFSFNAERLEWARHGGWDLPFDGEAFYVRDLGAWVGLCSRHRGRLAACRVVGARRGGAEPDSKCGRDLLFRQKWRRHIEANLVYMGDTKFCLLETLTTEEKKDRSDIFGLIVPMLLRVVTFRVQYSWDGELRVVDRRSRVYNLPWYSSGQKPQAFWI